MTKKTNIGICQSLYWSGFSYKPMNVEVDISRGLFHFNIVGLADKAMTESKFRILSALKNCEFDLPQRNNQKVIVSLLPSNEKKNGTYADIAIAFSYLLGSRQLPSTKSSTDICCIGEVRLDGSVTVKQDIVHLFQAGIKFGMKRFIVPKDSTEYFNLIPGIKIAEIESLSDLKKPLNFRSSEDIAKYRKPNAIDQKNQIKDTNKTKYKIDSLHGLDYQKRALMIAIAGNHHILFSGLPGCGKSALADCANELLDDMTGLEAIETYSIYQGIKVSGNLQIYKLFFERPSRKPHNNIKSPGLIGEGYNKPGELSLAHNGIIILNELCEFNKQAIESLRDPMENQKILIHKHGLSHELKLYTTIIGTTNLCPCGKIPIDFIDMNKSTNIATERNSYCKCNNYQISRYQYKISEPILDRFPMVCTFLYKTYGDENSIKKKENNNEITGKNIRKSIIYARDIQRKRNDNLYNQYLNQDQIISFGIDDKASECLKNLENIFNLSNRKILHVLRISRTIADIEKSEIIEEKHLLEATSYVKTKPFLF